MGCLSTNSCPQFIADCFWGSLRPWLVQAEPSQAEHPSEVEETLLAQERSRCSREKLFWRVENAPELLQARGGADAGEEAATRPGRCGSGHRGLLRGGEAPSRSCRQQSHHENNSLIQGSVPIPRKQATRVRSASEAAEATPWGRGRQERKGSHCFLPLGLPGKQGLNSRSERKFDAPIKEQRIFDPLDTRPPSS